MNRQRHQSGFTLVELMVALLVGLFLAAGMVAVTQHNKTTYSNQTALSQLQDNERFALEILNDVIQQAGYYPDPTIHTAVADMPANGSFAAAQPVFGTASPDTISVQYSLANLDSVLTCAGQQNTTGAAVAFVNQFTVIPPTSASLPLSGQLQCTVTGGGNAPQTVTLVTGVTGMTIYYGVNGAGSSVSHDVTEYKSADQMSASDWMNVTSVQVTLTFANPLYGQPGQTNSTINIMRTIAIMTRAGVTT